MKPFLDQIHEYAEQHGLSAIALRSILDAITLPNCLDQCTKNALIKSLFPKDKISSDLACIVVNGLGQGSLKASVATQQSLLKWLIMAYDYLGDPSILSKLYNVLFNLLDTTQIRLEVCHLLALITRKKHVNPVRVQFLKDISQNVGRESVLPKLMQVFNEHVPGSFDVSNLAGQDPGFSHPDLAWSEQLLRIQEKAISDPIGSVCHSDLFIAVRKGAKRVRVKSDLGKANEIGSSASVDKLVTLLEKDKIPDLTINHLDDPIIQNYLTLQTEDIGERKVDDIIPTIFDAHSKAQAIEQDIRQPVSTSLKSILSYTQYIKVSVNLPDGRLSILKKPRPSHNQPYHFSLATSPAGTAIKTRKRSFPSSPTSPSTDSQASLLILHPKNFNQLTKKQTYRKPYWIPSK